MIISFDLDETLFVNPRIAETEPPIPFPYSLIYKEHFRKGATELVNSLRQRGHSIYIYTTSFRTPGYIRGYLKRYKIKVDRIINGKMHRDLVQRDRPQIMPSKYPPHFKIDIHVDDELSVKQNGESYGFNVVLLREDDSSWTEKVLKEVKRWE